MLSKESIKAMKRIAREKAGIPEGRVARRKLEELGELKQEVPFIPFRSMYTGLDYNTWREWLGSDEFFQMVFPGRRRRRKRLEG